jgi:hypothetical protein
LQRRPERVLARAAPYAPGGRAGVRIVFARDSDGCRIELVDGGGFETPPDQED